jgi:pimeloyl-ACP methyl ester carboxylesterase
LLTVSDTSAPSKEKPTVTNTITITTSSTHSLTVDGIGPVAVTVTQRGQGHPFLLLHGGAGPQSVSGFADLLAETQPARVITPTHPGFGGTSRPEALSTIRGLAALYVALLDELDLTDVTVVGNSIGGWVTAEMALIASPRISRIVLIGATGIDVPGHSVEDFFSLTLDEVFKLSFHNPGPFFVDPTTLPPAAQAIAAGNRAALAAYAGTSSDPSLIERLSAVKVPALVLSGESDEIVDPAYGRAYAQAIPGARFQLLTETGHVPQIETPHQLLPAIWSFAASRPASG